MRYIKVTWPDIQLFENYMECIISCVSADIPTYMVPEDLFDEVMNNKKFKR